MKFLQSNMEGKNLMFLNIYYDKGNYDWSNPDDVLDIIYKDIDTGKQYVETIKNPLIEIWITKKEYRNHDYIKDFEEKDYCIPVKVHYKSRYKEVAKLLNIPQDKVKFSPYVYQFDMDICHFYMIQFALEYPTDAVRRLSIGFLDIENDIINVTGFPEPGEAPINCVSFMDVNNMQMYTLVLTTDNVPVVAEDHRKYAYYEKLRAQFNKQLERFNEELPNMPQLLNEEYDDIYGKINYQILTFDVEINLIVALFEIVKACHLDYLGIWNSPYDMQNLFERPKVLGYDPNTIIVDSDFGKRHIYFEEDRNAMVHKRKHKCDSFTKYTVIDQMVVYAGIRSGRGKLPSVKLNAIAKKELGDSKLDYSEYGNIRMFPYMDFVKFILYNIKDVLLQFGIDSRTNDMASFYATVYLDCVRPNEVFTSTTVISNSLRKYAFVKENSVMGSNKNKLFKVNAESEEELIDPDDIIIDDDDDVVDDEIDLMDTDDVDEDFDTYVEVKDPKKKDKFKGAFVMSPIHMTSSGFKILGNYSKYVHEHVVDEDIGSEYPTAMSIMNSCNATLVGKVMLVAPRGIKIPFYENMYFVDKKDDVGYNDYRKDSSNFMMEVLTEDDPLNFGSLFCNLPEPGDIFEYLDNHIEDFVK